MKKKYDLNNLLHMLKLVGGTYVIVEDGNPRAVLMEYGKFEELVTPHAIDKIANQVSEIEKINKQITSAQQDELPDELLFEEIDDTRGTNEDDLHVEPIDPF